MRLSLEKLGVSRERLVKIGAPVLALVLVASVVTGREKPSVAEPEPAARLAKVEIPDAELDLEKMRRSRAEEKVVAAADPFARRSFAPAQEAQAAQAPAAPQPPQAPALPFTYLGKVIEDGKLSVFLARGEDSYSVQPGRKLKLDAQYRVDKVTESAVVFTYLPLNTKQTLDIPAVNQ